MEDTQALQSDVGEREAAALTPINDETVSLEALDSFSSLTNKGKGKGTAPKAPPPKGHSKGKQIVPKSMGKSPNSFDAAGYKPSNGADLMQALKSVKLKPTQTIVRQTHVSSHQNCDLPRMPMHVTSEHAENALVDGGYRRPFGIFDANQALVKEGFAKVAHTSLIEYSEGDTEKGVAALIQEQKEQGRAHRGKISISESWTDEALRFLRRERHPDEDHVKLVALNYANCSYPGGNYSDGGMVRAQEEELCRQFPALLESLRTCSEAGVRDGPRMCEYGKHVFGARIGDGYRVARNVLFTEEIQCLRGPEQMSYRLLNQDANKVKSGFVEAAAPIFNRGWDSGFEQWRAHPEEWYEKVFLNVFWAAKSINRTYDVIVVGPWGCGAFGNDPNTVASSFVNVIHKHNLLNLYREIHFCMGRSLAADATVGGACNYNVAVFRQVLGNLGIDLVEDYTEELQMKAMQWLEDEVCKTV